MKKLIPLFSIVIIAAVVMYFIPFESTNEKEHQENTLILGEFELKELKSTTNKNWLEAGYEDYTLKPEVVEKIKSEIEEEDFYISVYMGTWCEDSQREIPALIKLLDQINFDFDKLTFVGVDEDKVVPNVSEEEREKLNVFNVPTIIVYDAEGKEINRFVEFPQETLEEDLLKIFSREDYKHVYDF